MGGAVENFALFGDRGFGVFIIKPRKSGIGRNPRKRGARSLSRQEKPSVLNRATKSLLSIRGISTRSCSFEMGLF